MAEGNEPQPLVAISTEEGSGAVHIRKTNNIVTLFINGQVTIDNDGIFYTIPTNCRPLGFTYFVASPAGAQSAFYLCEVNPNGNLKVYNRDVTFIFLYGTVTYPIA